MILVFGGTGQVGGELKRLLGDEAFFPERSDYDLLEPTTMTVLIQTLRPQMVINAAADTRVDLAESEPRNAFRANAATIEFLAHATYRAGGRLLHFSTDYVFDGAARSPYREEDVTGPIGVYGEAKLRGEQAVLEYSPHVVLRLSWVYGTVGRNFALTMLRLAREGKTIRVVDDQIGSPTYARCIAEGAAEVARQMVADPKGPGGLYHLSAGGSTSWFGFASALLPLVLGEAAPEVHPIPTSQFPTPARRPAYSVLDNRAIGERFGVRLPDWQAQMERWAADLPPQ